MWVRSNEGKEFELQCPKSIHSGAFEDALPAPCRNKILALLESLLKMTPHEQRSIVADLPLQKLLDMCMVCDFLDIQELLSLSALVISLRIRQKGCEHLGICNSSDYNPAVLRVHLQRRLQKNE